MRNKLTVALSILLILIVVTIIHWMVNRNGSKLINPEAAAIFSSGPVASPTPSPSPQFHFDSSTDLNNELGKVGAQVSDGDFSHVEQITASLK